MSMFVTLWPNISLERAVSSPLAVPGWHRDMLPAVHGIHGHRAAAQFNR